MVKTIFVILFAFIMGAPSMISFGYIDIPSVEAASEASSAGEPTINDAQLAQGHDNKASYKK